MKTKDWDRVMFWYGRANARNDQKTLMTKVRKAASEGLTMCVFTLGPNRNWEKLGLHEKSKAQQAS